VSLFAWLFWLFL